MAGKRRFRFKFFRIVRDVSIVLILCGFFYSLSYYFSQPETQVASTAESEAKELITAAQQNISKREWDEAANNYKKLIELDPYDGSSVMRLAAYYYSRRQASWQRIYYLRRQDQANSQDEQECWDAEAKYGALAIEAYEQLIDFARYRGDAYTSLARIYSTQSRIESPEQAELKKKAMDYLNKLVDERYCTLRGISVTQDFEFIAKEPGFRELCLKEKEIRENDPFYNARHRENWANFMGMPRY